MVWPGPSTPLWSQDCFAQMRNSILSGWTQHGLVDCCRGCSSVPFHPFTERDSAVQWPAQQYVSTGSSYVGVCKPWRTNGWASENLCPLYSRVCVSFIWGEDPWLLSDFQEYQIQKVKSLKILITSGASGTTLKCCFKGYAAIRLSRSTDFVTF